MEQTALLGILGAVAAALWAFWVEIARLRMETAQQANRDLLAKRFAAYAKLWSKTAPTAIYSGKSFRPQDVDKFRRSLSEWYFSEDGGIYLTARTREFYFALQDLLGEVAASKIGWTSESRPVDPKHLFRKFLESAFLGAPPAKRQMILLIERPSELNPDLWRTFVGEVTKQLLVMPLDPKSRGDQIFSAVQQVSSVLRTNLTVELGSRLDVKNSFWSSRRREIPAAGLAAEPGSICDAAGAETEKHSA